MKFRRICDSFALSLYTRGTSRGSSNTSATSSVVTIGLNIPRSALNRSTISNHAGEIVILRNREPATGDLTAGVLRYALAPR